MRTCPTIVLAALVAGCASLTPQTAPPVPMFEREMLDAAQQYLAWSRVSDYANWAPTDCRVPPPAGIQTSQSTDAGTHGRKLYYLYARDAGAYRSANGETFRNGGAAPASAPAARVGQTIVKETWFPSVDPDLGAGRAVLERVGRSDPVLGDPGPLFIMHKLEPGTPGTDEGWVYGVVSADASTVIASGRIESCMGCHTRASADRLFGLPYARR